MDVSIVIPVYNEDESLPELCSWIDRVVKENNLSCEIILVDDGSTDNSWEVINELRRRRSRPQLEADPEGGRLAGLPDEAPEVAEQVAGDERRSLVRCALQVLPQSQRDAVKMAFLDELTHEEVATALRVPLGTTKTRIRSGLLKLRVELTSLGVAA